MFSNCVNLIKISIKHRKKGFIIHKNKKNLEILKNFLKINIINFVKIKDNKIIVFIKYYNNKPTFKNIINIIKPSNKKFISLKDIKKINNKYNWVLIISTNKGIINNYEAANLNVGGLVLAKIWN